MGLPTSFLVILIILSFVILAYGADMLVANIKILTSKYRLNIFLLGIILGFFTSTPELILGLTAVHHEAASLSLGNLLGGIIVLFGLILGLAIIVHRTIKTDGQITTIAPSILILLLPLILGLKGSLNRWDGLIMIISYITVVLYNARTEPSVKPARPLKPPRLARRYLLLSLLGLALIIVSSQVIISALTELLERWQWPPLVAGVLLLAIGTNLPEIVVTIKGLVKQASDLSISSLIGSAMSNVVIAGILLQFGSFSTRPFIAFAVVASAICLLSICLLLFYKTQKQFSRWEGAILLFIYLLFLIAELKWAIY